MPHRMFALLSGLSCLASLTGQTAWTQLTPAVVPSARHNAAWAYDSARDRVVMFGGSGSGLLDETWEWDGSSWIQMSPATRPPARWAAAMAYHPLLRRTVLFGGGVDTNGNITLGDTWEWDGTNWTQVFPPLSPPPNRFANDLVFYPPLGGLVLFGGRTGTTGFADTWLYLGGGVWIQLSPANSPPARCCFAMTLDVHERLVLYGGWLGANMGDTWEFDGATWTQRAPLHAPGARWGHKMAYDAARRRSVLSSGYSGAYLPETWEWDGSDWLRRTPPLEPSGRIGHLLAFMPPRGQCFLWGGSSGTDAWNYGPVRPATFALRGAGCPGSNNSPPVHDAIGLPYAGAPITLHLSRARPSTAALTLLGSRSASVDLGGAGAPGCTLLLAPVLWLATPVDTVGEASLPLTIPADPALAGGSFYSQFVVSDPTVNALGLVLSNGGVGVVGLP